MTDGQHPPLLKASDIQQQSEFEFHHPLNPQSEVYLRSLSRATGLNRIAVTLARIPAGKESFIYHAHSNEEEWIYILSGRGMAEIGDREHEVGPGDFMGFGLPQAAHHLRNPFDEDLVYLVGGEVVKVDLGTFPRHGKRAIRDGDNAYLVDAAAMNDFWSSESPPS
jgi:uncharacterized cupin superfamily protein